MLRVLAQLKVVMGAKVMASVSKDRFTTLNPNSSPSCILMEVSPGGALVGAVHGLHKVQGEGKAFMKLKSQMLDLPRLGFK